MTRAEAIARLRAVVDADDEIAQLKRAREAGFHVLPWTWRDAYRLRERADREAWGQNADDRASFARELLALLSEGTAHPAWSGCAGTDPADEARGVGPKPRERSGTQPPRERHDTMTTDIFAIATDLAAETRRAVAYRDALNRSGHPVPTIERVAAQSQVDVARAAERAFWERRL